MNTMWLFLRLDPRELHFMPGDEHQQHRFQNCPCKPTVDPKEPNMFVHNLLNKNGK